MRRKAGACRPGPIPIPSSSQPSWSASSARPGRSFATRATCLEAGDYHTLDYLGESVVVIRGHDGVLRAFTNVCRHRGSRILDGASGCARTIVCPYHAWTYNLDGSLRGIPQRETYGPLDTAKLGLVPVETGNLSGVHLRAAERRRSVGRRDDGALSRTKSRSTVSEACARRAA